jgi:phospholipase C
MVAETDDPGDGAVSRRAFLSTVGALGGVVVSAAALDPIAGAATRAGPLLVGRAARTSPIKTIVVSCQENHSFDHYVGKYAGLPAGYGIPARFANSGVTPFHFTDLTDGGHDPNHDWSSTHDAYANGRMDGFVSNGNGRLAMGYYDASDLAYYYSLLPKSTLCAEYFCGVLSETLPNRLVLYAGTSGGITSDSAPANGSLTWPCVTHLLTDAGITFKNYNFHCPTNY